MTTDERKRLEAMVAEWEREAAVDRDSDSPGAAIARDRCAAALRAFLASVREEAAPAMTLEDAERIVKAKYPKAHPVVVRAADATPQMIDVLWSISDGTRTLRGIIMIPGVGWHDTIESAWMAAARIVQGEQQPCKKST